ncbi:hypothetical protein KI387_017617, partial [Taxus chinensis]
MWLEAAKLPLAWPYVKPWEIHHQLEYRISPNPSNDEKFAVSESNFMFSDQMRGVAQPRESGGATERLDSESGSDLSKIPESVLVRNALYALQGVESAVNNLEIISKAFCSQPADRSSHSISSLWHRMSSTNALGKLLHIIAHAGQIYCQLGKFVDYFLGKRSKTHETVVTSMNNKGDEIKGKRNRKLKKSKGNKNKCWMSDEETVPEEDLASSPPFSLVNQAFAIALRCILQGYLAALNTLTASVAHRRSKKNDDRHQIAPVSSSEEGCLTSVVSQEITLLELYLHTGELQTHIQALGSICMLADHKSVSEAVPVESDLATKAFQDFPRGADLLTYLYNQLQVADPIHRPLLKFLFARACRPYVDFIKSWIYRAVVKDPYKEFIVEGSENIESISCIGKGHANHFPVSSIRVRDGVFVPCFLKHVSTPLLRAGQQLQVLTRLLETTEFGKQIPNFMSTCMPSGDSTQLSSLEAILGSWAYFSNENASCEPVLVYSKSKLEDLMQKREKANQQMVERLEKLFVGLSNICRQKRFMVVPVSYSSQCFHGSKDYQGNSQKMQKMIGKANDYTEKGNTVYGSRTLDTWSKESHEEYSSKFLEGDVQRELGTSSEDADTDTDSSELLSDEDNSSDNILMASTVVSSNQLKQAIFKDDIHETPKGRLDSEKIGSLGDKVGSEILPHCGVSCKNWDPVLFSGLNLSTDATQYSKLDSLISDYQRGTKWPQIGLPKNPFLVALACENKSNDYFYPDFSGSDNAWDIAPGKALGPVQRSHQNSETFEMTKTAAQGSQMESKHFTKESCNNHEHSDFFSEDSHHSLDYQISCSYMAFHPLLTRNAWGHLQYLMPEKSLSDRLATTLPYYDFSSVTENPETFTKNTSSKDFGLEHSFPDEHHGYMRNRISNEIGVINHENKRTNLADGCQTNCQGTFLRKIQPSGELFSELDRNDVICGQSFMDPHDNYLMSDSCKEDSLPRVFGGGKWQTSLGYSENDESLAGGCVRDSEIALEIPLDVVIDKCILQEIMLQYRCISDFTVKLLAEGFGFKKHLLALRRYFFMEVADWADGFVISLCQHKWSPTGSHQRLLEVRAMLESALLRSSCEGDEYDDRLYIYIKDASGMPHTENSLRGLPNSTGASSFIDTNCVNAFDFIGLGYRVDWPLNIILTPEALNMYNSIFSFLIQIKLTMFSLCDIWNCLREFTHCVNRSYKLTQDNEEMERFRVLMQLRQQVNHFIAALQQYVQSQLLHVVWHKFLHLLQYQGGDMLDLESVHTAYLSDSLHTCFLDLDMSSVKEIICNIMQCVLDFRSCFDYKAQNYEEGVPFELTNRINYSR